MEKILSNNPSDYRTFAPFRRNIQCLICGEKVDIRSTSFYMCHNHLRSLPNIEKIADAYHKMVFKNLWTWSFFIIWFFGGMMGLVYLGIKIPDFLTKYMIFAVILMFILPIILVTLTMDDKFEDLVKKLYADLNPETTRDPDWFPKLASLSDFNNLNKRLKYHWGRLTMLPMLLLIPLCGLLYYFIMNLTQ